VFNNTFFAFRFQIGILWPEPRLSSRPETAKEQVIYMPLDGGPIC
jgi:hypothetical protein